MEDMITGRHIKKEGHRLHCLPKKIVSFIAYIEKNDYHFTQIGNNGLIIFKISSVSPTKDAVFKYLDNGSFTTLKTPTAPGATT